MEILHQLDFDGIPAPRRRKMTDAEKHPSPGFQRCGACYEVLPQDCFTVDNRKSRRIASNCRECARLYVKDRYETLDEGAKQSWRERYLRNNYGITSEEYDAMFASQGGGCAICGAPPDGTKYHKRLSVDHDHETGAIRGLLCTPCNQALGSMRDNPAVLRAAAAYLETYGR